MDKANDQRDGYVTCAVCHKRYKGKVPKGGDGSVLFPYKHRQVDSYGDFGQYSITTSTCPGSFQAALEYRSVYE